MTPFIQLAPGVQALILTLLLALFLANFYILAVAMTRTRRQWVAVAASVPLPLCFTALAALTAAVHLPCSEKQLPAVVPSLAALPAAVYAVFLFLGGVAAFLLLRLEWQHQNTALARTSIKESLDNLPAGLCFANEQGLVLLANRRMDSLCHALTGSDLQDAVEFWEALTQGTLTEGAQRISAGPIIRINNRTWSFSRRPLNTDRPVIQITAIDATDLDALHIRLQKENEALTLLGVRLRRYSQEATAVKAKEERLAIKIRLHAKLGFSLLATHRLLALMRYNGKSHVEIENVLSAWERNIALLKGTDEGTLTPNSLDAAAAALGMQLQQRGSLPRDSKAAKLIADFTAECLTNARRHAGASELYLELGETSQTYNAVFTNNGAPPAAEVEEGGGLVGLRHRVVALGGSMAVSSHPRFAVAISLPKERSENVGPRPDSRE